MPTRTAEEWGRAHGSCENAMEWRRTLGTATQRTAWRRCQRGDWMIWQLMHGLTAAQLAEVMPALARAVEAIVERAIREHALHCGVPAVEAWAARWLSGEDRSEAAAWAARAAARATWAAAAAWAATWAVEAAAAAARAVEATAGVVELRLQAQDIRREIPRWPGEV